MAGLVLPISNIDSPLEDSPLYDPPPGISAYFDPAYVDVVGGCYNIIWCFLTIYVNLIALRNTYL